MDLVSLDNQRRTKPPAQSPTHGDASKPISGVVPAKQAQRIGDPGMLKAHLIRRGETIIINCAKQGEPLDLSNLQVALARENEARGDPPLPVGEAFELAAQLYANSVTAEAAVATAMRNELYSLKPIKPRSPHGYLVGTSSDTQEGWFPRDEISAVAGPSGGGKTRWMLELIGNVKRGESIFGRPVNSVPHLFVSYDRSKRSFETNLRRMRLQPDAINVYRPTKEEAKKLVIEFLPVLLYRPEYRDVGVVIIEGADMKVPKGRIIDLAEVSSYADDLQRLAERLGIHMILTLGTGKMKPNEKYLSLRERIIGSSAWGRKLETIVYLEPDEHAEDLRQVTILTRNAAEERHKFGFENGRLVEVFDGPVKEKLEQWISNQLQPGESFTLETAQAATNVPKSTAQSALTQLVGEGKVRKRKRGTYQRPGGESVEDGPDNGASHEKKEQNEQIGQYLDEHPEATDAEIAHRIGSSQHLVERIRQQRRNLEGMEALAG